MATPNINDSTKNITGFTQGTALTTTNATAVLNNPVSSGKLLKVNSVYVANVDGTNNADVTLRYYTQDDIGGTGFALASTVVVPADATVVVVGKDAPIYLREDSSLGATASAASDLEVVVSYEEIG
jgi:hypothetical protein